MEDVRLWEVLLGLGLGLVVAVVGRRLRLLSVGGALVAAAALLLSTGLVGWAWGGLVLVHLVGEGLWAFYRLPRKRALGQRFAPAERRRHGKVLARLGWPTLVALYGRVGGDPALVFSAFVGAMAAATADVWNTEVGVLNPEPPRLITTRRKVEPGSAGAVSPLGVVAALGGAWLIGFLGLGLMVLAAWIEVSAWSRALLWLPLAATIGGVAGSLVDSLLGATAQAIYYCEECEVRTESPVHRCGETARRVRGVTWLTDDLVDLVCGVSGAAVTALLVGSLAGLAA